MQILNRASLSSDDALGKFGAMLIPEALKKNEVETLRDHIGAMENDINRRLIQAPEILKEEKFIENIFLNPLVLLKLGRIYGNNTALFPSFQLQINSFTQNNFSRTASGLHVDASEEVACGRRYLKFVLPAWVNIGCYLQDYINDGWGGGIAIIPGSQKFIRLLLHVPLIGGRIAKILCALCRRFYPDRALFLIPTEPGDILIFDNRVIHASVPGEKIHKNKLASKKYQTHVSEIPAANNKYVFYWFCGENELREKIFQNNFLARAKQQSDSRYLGGFDYSAAVNLSFPKDYPPEFVETTRKLGVNVVSART